ncbi:MAG TPA: hypothetical protein VGM90_32810 [Kofleriaceae bacterium]|jgi:hypothetical protein
MNRLVLTSTLLALSATAMAAPKAKPTPLPPATLPAVGDALPLAGTQSWATKDWLYDVPSDSDAAGKVVVHWFCGPKQKTCADDLARIITLRETGRVYVVAHIDGSKAQAKKLDPIRESEGVGHGTLAFGAATTKLMKQLALTGPASIVVDVDGKVQLVSTGSSPADLDARDAKINDLVKSIRAYKVTVGETPANVKPGDKFNLSISIALSPWLKWSATSPSEYVLTVPPDFKCDAKSLKGDQLKPTGPSLTASVSCTAPKGSYEARGELRFGYTTGSGGDGLGTEGGKWKFEVKP